MTPWCVALSVHHRALFLDQHERCCGHAFVKVYYHVIILEWCETEVGKGRKWPFRLSNNFKANKILNPSKTQSASVLMVKLLLGLHIFTLLKQLTRRPSVGAFTTMVSRLALL